jgi:hypothetical protein
MIFPTTLLVVEAKVGIFFGNSSIFLPEIARIALFFLADGCRGPRIVKILLSGAAGKQE